MEWRGESVKRPRLAHCETLPDLQKRHSHQAETFEAATSDQTDIPVFDRPLGPQKDASLPGVGYQIVEPNIVCYDTLGAASFIRPPSLHVCFGSIISFIPTYNNIARETTKLSLGSGTQLLNIDGQPCMHLKPTDVEILRLFRSDGVDFEMLWEPGTINDSTKNRDGKLWVTLYGEQDLASDLGVVLQDLDIYLQDPIYAERNTPVWNPHAFQNDINVFTRHLKKDFRVDSGFGWSSVSIPDMLAEFISEDSLPETEGCSLLRTTLKPHQKRGLTFMSQRERGWRFSQNETDVWITDTDHSGKCSFINSIIGFRYHAPPPQFRGGIMADQMGLGKSLSMIALIMQDQEFQENSSKRSTLLVVPPSLLQNWEAEIKRHVDTTKFSWRRHHGSNRLLGPEDITSHRIILTSYSTMAAEWRTKGPESIIFTYQWHRVVLDEAHYIKDPATITAKAAYALKADCRWAVTGTLIQNRLSELWSYFRFLRVFPYSERSAFDEDITDLWSLGREAEAVARLKKLLNFIMLRRPSSILHLPKRTDHRVLLDFDHDEKRCYDRAKVRAVSALDDIPTMGCESNRCINVLAKINSLRMICTLGTAAESSLLYPDSRSPTPLDVPENGAAAWNVATATMALKEVLLRMTIFCNNCQSDINSLLGDDGVQGNEGVSLGQPYVVVTKCFYLWCSFCDSESHDGSPYVSYCPCTPQCPYERIQLGALPSTPSSSCREMRCGTKIRALVNDLRRNKYNGKSIVFSFWKTTLDLANASLSDSGIRCVQIDGKIPSKRRSEILDDFTNCDDVRVLLMSISCGSTGLTLTAASRVYLMEPQWNPSIEEQALARVYRLGQTSEVTTIRFVMRNSIEEYIVDIQDNKNELTQLFLIPGNSSNDVTKDRAQKLRRLLK